MSDHTFCRMYLRTVMEDVHPITTPKERKAAWAYMHDRTYGHGEFHGPDNYYWHGTACCLWSARANGWSAWLDGPGAARQQPAEGAGEDASSAEIDL